jgi:hypothetical protein
MTLFSTVARGIPQTGARTIPAKGHRKPRATKFELFIQ